MAEAALCTQAERDQNSSIVAALEEERAAAMAAAQRQVCVTVHTILVATSLTALLSWK